MDHEYANNKSRDLKRKKGVTYCCVPQCSQYASEGISFHLFPKDPILRKKWESALRMGKAATNTMRVCSKHFNPKDFFPSSKYSLKCNMNPILLFYSVHVACHLRNTVSCVVLFWSFGVMRCNVVYLVVLFQMILLRERNCSLAQSHPKIFPNDSMIKF